MGVSKVSVIYIYIDKEKKRKKKRLNFENKLNFVVVFFFLNNNLFGLRESRDRIKLVGN